MGRTESPKPVARAKPRPSAPTPVEEEEREPRGARRKRETRLRLMRAAFRLFGERGVDAVAINEVTEAADVGFGSFYNHFPSKEAIYEAVVDAVFGEFADTLDRTTADVADPVEVISISVRRTILRAQSEPLWGRFFAREALNPAAMTRGLAPRLMRDIAKATSAKRIDPTDPMMASMLAGGCVLAAVATEVASSQHGARALKQLGLDTKDLASRAAAAILEALGLPRAEAKRLAQKPMPRLEAKPALDMFE